ncbi:MogA/MoaB family molybdenum cofactor biosynthesis protein [Clostridium omnivorum]|uniref:Molybdenum cofactor biosynthesis protein n=1 Tax=Clostridium omnivorum TaxID=1604902 RepID=A0ABQ5NAK3_9CLOT|nr:MogA/MoaB family molybdenum cofactor biosynthesis protein [Clostridium sp. E14]GLC32295.1 molybdenum cofactor biosynthesis protein [Clostridium sp. E14]
MFTVGIITISDKGSKNLRVDLSGPEIKSIIEKNGGKVSSYIIIPDDKELIMEKLKDFADIKSLDLILTTGGTGFSIRDVTPEATIEVVDKLVPGIAEAMRYESLKITPRAMLSRAASGIRKNSLIINLPGSPKGVRENLNAILPALIHGIEILKGEATECGE